MSYRSVPTIARTILFLVAASFGAFGSGCGGGPEGLAERPAPPPAPPVAAEAEAKKGELRNNESWDRLRDHFLGLQNDPTTGFVRRTERIRDPFEPQLVKFAKAHLPQEVEETAAAGAAAVAEVEPPPDYVDNTPQPVALGPTQKYQVRDYRVVLIRWGTSVNKAVVEDPEGASFVITKDMKLGNKNGVVTDITRYEVRVKEDDQAEEVVISVEPPILAIKEAEGTTERLFTSVKE